MALMYCPKCESEYEASSDVTACPNCACPVEMYWKVSMDRIKNSLGFVEKQTKEKNCLEQEREKERKNERDRIKKEHIDRIELGLFDGKYLFDYVNEKEYKTLERSLRKYNMLAYKKLYFDYYPSLKNGNFLGKLISTNKTNGTQTYELKLPTDALFSKVHGDIKLYYTVYEKEKIVMLDKLEPVDILSEGYASELVTYKGVMVSKQHSDKDMFRINLLNMLDK